MAIDWTINFWQVVSALGGALIVVLGFGWAMQRLYYQVDKRVTLFEARLTHLEQALLDTNRAHATQIKEQGARIERWEAALIKVVGDLQRVIGRMEVSQNQRWDGRERRGDTAI